MTREELNQKKHQEIVNEQRHERRKKVTIIIFKLSFVLIVSFILFYLYTTYISSKLISVKEERIIDKNIPSNFSGLKVVHFSDLHFGTTVFYEETKRLVDEINYRKPDLIIFTGDLIDEKYELKTYFNINLLPFWITMPRYEASTRRPKMSYIGALTSNIGRSACSKEAGGVVIDFQIA